MSAAPGRAPSPIAPGPGTGGPDDATRTRPPARESARQAVVRRWRRWRWPLAVAATVVLAALIVALATGGPDDGQRLGPDNPGPQGSRALVRVLDAQGVRVDTPRRSDQAVAATGRGDTLLVTDTRVLGPTQLDRLATDDAATLVLVEPDEVALSRLAPQVRAAGIEESGRRAPGCDDPTAAAAGAVRAGGHLYGALPAADAPVRVCYPWSAGGSQGSWVSTRVGGRTVIVIGQSDLLTNEHLAADGNAALALRSLGGRAELVWYLPDPLEPAAEGERPTLRDLLPDWVAWVVIQLLVVVAVAVGWRARRLGPLVTEPLPVVVRAAETQEGRARLYRQAGARGRAANTLRTAAVRRIAARLAAPPGTTTDGVVTMVTAATGRDEVGVRTLLLGPPPDSDAALVRLADDLDTLERELSRHDRKGSAP